VTESHGVWLAVAASMTAAKRWSRTESDPRVAALVERLTACSALAYSILSIPPSASRSLCGVSLDGPRFAQSGAAVFEKGRAAL